MAGVAVVIVANASLLQIHEPLNPGAKVAERKFPANVVCRIGSEPVVDSATAVVASNASKDPVGKSQVSAPLVLGN